MERHPDGGMYSIKLVHPAHLNHMFFTPDATNDGKPRLMNFSDQGHTPALAARIRPGHRAIVYLTHPVRKFLWAIEYTGTMRDGQRAALAYPSLSGHLSPEWCRILLPIRFLATITVEAALSAHVVLQQAGVEFTPNAFPMKHISAAEYRKIFDAVNWQWVDQAEGVCA